MTKQGKDKSQKTKSDGAPQVPAGIHIGISDEDRAAIAKGLSALLADTYTLYLTTHNFHWNVTGPMFNTLHTMFMAQYTELWNAVDPVAERIRALGHHAPGSYAQFGKLTSLPDAPAQPPKALEMVRILVQGHEAVARLEVAIERAAVHKLLPGQPSRGSRGQPGPPCLQYSHGLVACTAHVPQVQQRGILEPQPFPAAGLRQRLQFQCIVEQLRRCLPRRHLCRCSRRSPLCRCGHSRSCCRGRRWGAANCRRPAPVCCWQRKFDGWSLPELLQTLLQGGATATVHTAAESIGARLQLVFGCAVGTGQFD
jgi:starvation-inducible DNA-binding protein